MPTGSVTVTVEQRLDASGATEVLDLVRAARATDGVGPISEHALLQVKHGAPVTARHLLARTPDGTLAGYAHLDLADLAQGPVGELVVHPHHRRQGTAKVLAEALARAADDDRLHLWAHGDHPGAAAFAENAGFRTQRALWKMRRSLDEPLPRAVLPAGYAVRSFRPGVDDDAWVRVNAKAFADHPEQGQLTREDLHQRMAEPWFDPSGFILLWQAGPPEKLAGFHWTKVHDSLKGAPLGEVYVLGVAPGHQGHGLGRTLTVIGLEHLRSRGLHEVMLYVDESNTAAVRTYAALGFARFDVDVLYGR
jgi:mycothiol synthase